MIIDFLCWIGIFVLNLFGLIALAAIAFVVAVVMQDRHHRKDEQRK